VWSVAIPQPDFRQLSLPRTEQRGLPTLSEEITMLLEAFVCRKSCIPRLSSPLISFVTCTATSLCNEKHSSQYTEGEGRWREEEEEEEEEEGEEGEEGGGRRRS
jgi:hypothetical protein